MTYFVLTSTEDGTSISEGMTKGQLDKFIQELIDDGYEPNFLSKIPVSDKGYWHVPDNSFLIIKGEIVVPKKKDVITKWEVD